MAQGNVTLGCAVFLLLTSAQTDTAMIANSFPEEAVLSAAPAVLPSLGCDACGQECCGNACCGCQPQVFVFAESLFLKLNHGTRHPVPVIRNQDTGATVLTTDNLGYDIEAGPRLGFGYQLNECGTIEASYFGLHRWHDSATATGDNNLRLPGDVAYATQDFFDAGCMRLDYSSELHNVEVNYLRQTGFESFSWLVGFRYLNFDESFNINAADIDAGRSSDYGIHACNHLYGGQLGGKWHWQWYRFGLDFVGKAGIYGNAGKQHTFLGDFDNTFILRDSTTRNGHTAFIGELGLNGTYRLSRTWYARAGYNLLWIEGISRAPDQLDFTDTADSGTALVFGQGAFLHGANVGLEARW